MTPALFWLAVGIGFFIFEIVSPGFMLFCFGIGGLAAAGVSLVAPNNVVAQVLTLCVVSVGSILLLKPLFGKKEGQTKPSNVDAMVGQTGRVVTAIDRAQDQGRVKVYGDEWRAYSEDGSAIPEGAEVTIVKVDGTKVAVKPIAK